MQLVSPIRTTNNIIMQPSYKPHYTSCQCFCLSISPVQANNMETRKRQKKVKSTQWLVTYHDGLPYCLQTVTHPGTNRAQCRVTLLIEYSALLHCVSKKLCHNFVKFPPTLIIFDRLIAERIYSCDVHLFSTSPNSRQRPTALNADVPNCYITL